MGNNHWNTPKWWVEKTESWPENFSVPFPAKVTKLLETTNISWEDMVGYIDAIISFFKDITSDDNLDIDTQETNTNTYNQAWYLDEVFKEVEWIDPKAARDFSSPELRFIWIQVNHLVQPFRNIFTAYEGSKEVPAMKQSFDEQVDYCLDRLSAHKNEIINMLTTYRSLVLNEGDTKLMTPTIFENLKRFSEENNVEIEIMGEEHPENEYYIASMPFQILVDNLFSNYQKYGKNGKLSITISQKGVMTIEFKNDYKSEDEIQWVLSSKLWNPLLVSLIDELYSWEMKVKRGKEEYKLEITGMQLSQKRKLGT